MAKEGMGAVIVISIVILGRSEGSLVYGSEFLRCCSACYVGSNLAPR